MAPINLLATCNRAGVVYISLFHNVNFIHCLCDDDDDDDDWGLTKFEVLSRSLYNVYT